MKKLHSQCASSKLRVKQLACVATAFMIFTAGCSQEPEKSEYNAAVNTASTAFVALESAEPPPKMQLPLSEPIETPDPWTADDIEAIARTLSGECYDDKLEDKRRVAEVILNRVSDGRWGATVTEVVTAKHQFSGYWNPSRDISESDREIATQALRDWYANDCTALSEYLFFEAGPNRENVFRKTF